MERGRGEEEGRKGGEKGRRRIEDVSVCLKMLIVAF